MTDKKNLVYKWEVPDNIRNYTGFDDIAKAYRIWFSDKATGGCIVDAKFNNQEEWKSNPWTVRPLIRHLIEQVKSQEKSIDFYKLRMDVIQEWQKSLPEPYRTECCNILANGKKEV